MFNRSLRLGDALDDYCSRCHGLTTHAVVSLAEGQPHKVRCQDCHSEHDFRRGKGGKPKKDEVKSLVRKLLDEMQGGLSTGPAEIGSGRKKNAGAVK